ncbi:MAG: diguanylate cyclase [Deltaproteobacteria bacterium]|nr:diguanylate cyclase [Deltaproteobacteria bacterium]
MAENVVLIIDDDESVHTEADRALGPPLAHQLLHARLPGDGIRMAVEMCPDVILLDINMPDMDGFKVCRALKENAATRDIPILFLTVDTKVNTIARALDCGAVDYVAKPFSRVELEARMRVALRGKNLIELLKDQARVDALTGLMNRAALDDALSAVVSSCVRTGTVASLLMFDIDHFKQINDQHGHGVGDEVLRALGACVKKCSRPYDTSCRYGGDEFAVIYGHTENRLLSEIRLIEVPAGDQVIGVSVSGGLVTTAQLDEYSSPADLMKKADVCLYSAKEAGRDRIVSDLLA